MLFLTCEAKKAYDVVPGAYIALRAGTVMSTPEGTPINESDLSRMLLRPSNKIRYVLTGSKELNEQLCELLRGALTMEQKMTDAGKDSEMS